MKIITVTGYKGGVGKSATAIHVADCLNGMGRTLLVDGDRNHTCLNWAKGGHLPFEVKDEQSATAVVAEFEYIVIDTKAQPSREDLRELAEGCELLILPTKPDVVSLVPAIQTSEDLAGCSYRLLITMVPPYPSKMGIELQEDLKISNVPVFNTMIRNSTGVARAAMAGKTLRQMPARQRLAWLDYQKLGIEILSIIK